MAKPTLGQIITAIPDPLLSDNFQLHFPNIPVGGDSKSLLLQCKMASKPGVTTNSAEVAIFGHVLQYATNKTFSHDMAVTYVENRSLQIHNILEEWSELIRGTQTQHGAFKSEYSRDGFLTVFNQKGETVAVYQVVNCWPSTVPDTPFDGTSSSIIDVATNFKYDYYYNLTTGVGNAVPTA